VKLLLDTHVLLWAAGQTGKGFRDGRVGCL